MWRSWAYDPALEPFYVLVNAWGVISTAELWIRLPSILAAATTVPLIFKLARRFLPIRASLLTAVLFLLLPAVSRYGQEARPYALTMLLSTVTMLWWLEDRRIDGWKHQARLVGVLVLLGLLHAYTLLILLVLLVVALVVPERDRRLEVLAVVRTGAITAVLLAPFLWMVYRGARGTPDPAALTPLNLAIELLRLPVGVLRPPAAPFVGASALLLALAGLIVALRRTGRARSGAALAAAWLLLPPAVLVAFQAATGAPGLVARYWTFSLPALALAAGFALDATWPRRRALALVLVIVVLGLPTQLAVRTTNGHAGQGWQALPEVLAGPDLANAVVLVEESSYRTLIANQPTLTARMPMVLDPAPSGRIQPQVAGRNSAQYDSLRSYPMAVLLENRAGTEDQPPDSGAFTAFRHELKVFRRPIVLCAYFGDPLGVFGRPDAAITQIQAGRLAELITATNQDQVRCTVPDPG